MSSSSSYSSESETNSRRRRRFSIISPNFSIAAAPRDRVVAVGNGAGSGVCRYLRDRAESARCEHIRAVTHHVELNASAEFMEQYIMNMNFNVL